MRLVIDIPDDEYERIQAMDWKNGHRWYSYETIAIHNGTPLPKGYGWIPVSEGLPENGQIVLFCDIDEDIMIGYHVNGRPDTHFSQDGTFEDVKNVRAWMPLPEPY